MAPIFQHGDLVVRVNKRDERGTIQGKPQPRGGIYFYRVVFPSSPNPVTAAEFDLDKVRLARTPEEILLDGDFGDHKSFSRLLTYERLQNPLQDTLYSMRASKTEFQPYQFKPLLKFLRSAKHRLLLADEVGLGKTIEAGFILCELLARHPHTFRRVLIVCKASLCVKWQTEMKLRFDLRFEIWKSGQLREFVRRYREDGDVELKAICSLESFRATGVMQDWEAETPQLDVLIIDEAHHLKNAETKVHNACRIAADSAEAVLALTATPIQIGSRDLYNLLSLLDKEEFSSFSYFDACMVFNSEIVLAEQKVARQDPDRFESAYRTLHDLGHDPATTLRRVWQTVGYRSSFRDFELGFNAVSEALVRNPVFEETLRLLKTANHEDRGMTVQIQRNLAELNFLSRIFSRTRRRDVYQGAVREARTLKVVMTPEEKGLYAAVLKYVRDSYRAAGKDTAFLFGLMMPQRQLASCIPAMVRYYQSQVGESAADEEVSDLEQDELDLAPESTPVGNKQLLALIDQWYSQGQPDSKFDQLKQGLEHLQETEPGAQVIIFSYFKKTLEYLADKLQMLGYSNTVISGSFSPEDRETRIADFAAGRYQILLSSEVGSEGLDFQFCHVLFNYDLPWNPMVVEQRIGRLDRFGQRAKKILIFNLSAPGTIEHEILTRLYSRINLFQHYIGDLEAIIGSEIAALTKDMFDPDLTQEQLNQRIEQAGLLLEKRKRQFDEWEKESPQFIGHDEYYSQEVERAGRLGRYIRAEDLYVFVRDFLAKFDKKTELVEQGGSVYSIEAGEKFHQFILRQPDHPAKVDISHALYSKRLRITFDPDLANADRTLHFVHVRHFLIRSIVREYSKQVSDFHPVAALRLTASGSLPSGSYVYVIGRATIRAAREQDLLLPVFVRLGSNKEISEDDSELTLGRMATDATTLSAPEPDPEQLYSALQAAESVFTERLRIRRQETERLNAAFIDARLSSVMGSYGLKLARKRELLARGKAKNQGNYVRMLEGSIKRLESERELREREIESRRAITAEHSVKAVGILDVV